MERYSWMIILAIIAVVALIGFFFFLFKDMEHVRLHKKSKALLLMNVSLLLISAVCIALSIYLYFDIQKQLEILGNL